MCDHAKKAGVGKHFFNVFKGQMPLQQGTVSRKLFKAIMGREARVITKTKELVSLKEPSSTDGGDTAGRTHCSFDLTYLSDIKGESMKKHGALVLVSASHLRLMWTRCGRWSVASSLSFRTRRMPTRAVADARGGGSGLQPSLCLGFTRLHCFNHDD